MFYFRKNFFRLKLYALHYWKHLLLIGFIFFCIILILSIFEAFLNPSYAEKWNPSLKNEDLRIFNNYSINALKHPFGFNDHPYPEKKEKACFRMIVLGDSVIFGDGLPMEQIWSRKLEKALKQKYPVEVLHWGQCGWSTLDQYEFFKKNFRDKKNIYEADLLLISWFFNDPDMGHISFDSHRLLSDPFFNIFTWVFPKLGSAFYDLYEFWEYCEISFQLYSDENLCRYQKVLHDLKLFCQEKKTDLFFVILSYGVGCKKELGKIENLLQKEDIAHLNLHPFVAEQIQNVSRQKTYASPVNTHPGPLLTTLYARYTLPELVKRYGKKMMERGSELIKNNGD